MKTFKEYLFGVKHVGLIKSDDNINFSNQFVNFNIFDIIKAELTAYDKEKFKAEVIYGKIVKKEWDVNVKSNDEVYVTFEITSKDVEANGDNKGTIKYKGELTINIVRGTVVPKITSTEVK